MGNNRTRSASQSKERSQSQNLSSKTNIRQSIRQLVWNTHIGCDNGTAPCYCCGATQISPFTFECGHIQARSEGGQDSVENLRPICGPCNRSMATMNMLEFMQLHNLPVTRHRFRQFYWLVTPLSVLFLASITYLWYLGLIVIPLNINTAFKLT